MATFRSKFTGAQIESFLEKADTSVQPEDLNNLEPLVITETVQFDIPTDYPNLAAAIQAVHGKGYGAGVEVIINYKTGHQALTGVAVRNGDYGYIRITSEDAAVTLNPNFVGVSAQDSGLPAESNGFIVGINARMPILDTIINANGVATNGYYATQGSIGKIGRPDTAVEEILVGNANAGVIGAEYNIRASGGSIIYAENCVARLGGYNLRATDGSRITASFSDLSGATISSVFANGASTVVIDGSDADDSFNVVQARSASIVSFKRGRGVNATNYGVDSSSGAVVDCSGSNFTNAGISGIRVTDGGRVHANNAIASSTQTPNQTTNDGLISGILTLPGISSPPTVLKNPSTQGVVAVGQTLRGIDGEFEGVSSDNLLSYWEYENSPRKGFSKTLEINAPEDLLDFPARFVQEASNVFGKVVAKSPYIGISAGQPYAVLNQFTPSFVMSGIAEDYIAEDAITTFASMFNFTRTSSATYRDSNGALQTVAAGTPRLDHHRYNPATARWERAGLLFESITAINRCLWSNTIRNNWAERAVSIATTNEIRANANSTLNSAGFSFTPSGEAMALQFDTEFLTHPFIQIADPANSANYININIQTGQIGTKGSNTKGATEPLGVGRFKNLITFGATIPVSGTINFIFVNSLSADYQEPLITTSVERYIVDNVQIEDGDKHTSFIPTNGTENTRQAETLRPNIAKVPVVDKILSVHLKAKMSFSLGDEVRFFDWPYDANNNTDTLGAFLRTNGSVDVRSKYGANSTILVEAEDSIAPGRHADLNLAFSWSDTKIQASIGGDLIASTPHTVQDAQPDLSAQVLNLFGNNFVGIIEEIKMFGQEVSTAGLQLLSFLEEPAPEATFPDGAILNAIPDLERIDFSWLTPSANGSPIQKYILTIFDNNGEFTESIDVGLVNSYTLENLVQVETYVVFLETVNGIGSTSSESITVKTKGPPGQMSAPTIVATPGGFDITFAAAAENNGFDPNNYVIEVTPK